MLFMLVILAPSRAHKESEVRGIRVDQYTCVISLLGGIDGALKYRADTD